MKYPSKRTALLILCTALYISLTILLQYTVIYVPQRIEIGSFVMSADSVRGIISSLQSIICILMVFINYKAGIVIASLLSTQSLISSLVPVIRAHSLSSLPGSISALLSIATLIIIYTFYKNAAVRSFTDYVTGLQNRRSYEVKLTQRLKSNKPFALAYVEIDNFKLINSQLGLQDYEYILNQIAKRLSVSLNAGDMLFKITGPTFAIAFNNAESAQEVKEKLQDYICLHTVSINSEKITISLACGVVFIDSKMHGKTDASTILRNAETALLKAQKDNDEKIVIYSEEMANDLIAQKEAEILIQESLKNNYFYLVYQPQYYTASKDLRGFETLIRCKKPDGSIVSPGCFIPAAEKSNLIMKIDDYVLRRAMEEFKPIINKDKSYTLSINVSAKNIGSESFADKIKGHLIQTEFPAQNLEIEITEYSFADSMKTTIKNILALKNLGVQIALDDFGTGYTSIAQLMKLPVDLLKIDKSLIDDIETNQSMRDMVDSVIYMGHIMNCKVISEGVENEGQLNLLKEHKCDYIQGFVWGKPRSLDEIKELCQNC
ncbi:MAG: bifunctional diguanylate cyclase/phosphodiesterase [Treponema sp.]|nr:bifunctional diguanylate cyclase/phosphodiesterase [Treponema sp.]